MPAEDRIRELALAAIDARALAADLLRPSEAQPRIPFSTLVAYASDSSFTPSPGFEARLAADARASADLRRLLANVARVRAPRLAAAASGAAAMRETDAARLTLTPSRVRPDQAYLRIILNDSSGVPPTVLVAGAADGSWHRLVLPPFTDGETQLLLDADAPAAGAFADPDAELFLG